MITQIITKGPCSMQTYTEVTQEIRNELQSIVGAKHIHFSTDSLEKYSRDFTEDLRFYPEVAVLPASTDEVAAVLRLANRHRIPVTPRGAGTGLSGAALPIHGGIVLSLERMSRIIELDEQNLMAVVEPGVITEALQNAVEAKGLFYPPDP